MQARAKGMAENVTMFWTKFRWYGGIREPSNQCLCEAGRPPPAMELHAFKLEVAGLPSEVRTTCLS